MRTDHVTDRATGPRAADPADVLGWRQRQLVAAGFDGPLAARLVGTPGIDLHALLDLVDRGCPPELAVRILDPLTDPDPRS